MTTSPFQVSRQNYRSLRTAGERRDGCMKGRRAGTTRSLLVVRDLAVGANKGKPLEADWGRGRRLLRPTEAQRPIGRKRLNVHAVGLIAAEAHQVAVLVAADDDGDMPAAVTLHRRE